LTQAHQVKAAQKFSDVWAGYGNAGKMQDYFGLQKTGHTANFYFRIIPEISGYGENYETVDYCGKQGSFLN